MLTVEPLAMRHHFRGSPCLRYQHPTTAASWSQQPPLLLVACSSASFCLAYPLSIKWPAQQRSRAFLEVKEKRRGFRCRDSKAVRVPTRMAAARSGGEPLKLMVSGAPASGKGTQCELIVEKFALPHIAMEDIVAKEVAHQTNNLRLAKEYKDDAGELAFHQIVTRKLKDSETGWLLDGYPRSLDQVEALEAIKVRPQIFILLEVPDDVSIERASGRRFDPLTGKIYHLQYCPPETQEIAGRLIQRVDDAEEKVKQRLSTYHANVEAVLHVYKDILKRVNGNRPKKDVFQDIAKIVAEFRKDEESRNGEGLVTSSVPAAKQGIADGSPRALKQENSNPLSAIEVAPAARRRGNWSGVPTKLNTTPHSREIRQYFYADVCSATKRAVEDGIHKLKVQITIPELNPEMDVYRIGTLLEIIREVAFTFANDGKRVRVCVQGSMGEGIFSGMPLQLAGTRQMLERMDWGEYGAKGTFINIGSVGAKEVHPEDDMFILMAPQNAVGNCIIDDLRAMVDAAGDRPMIILNPRLKDLPGSGGVMQVQGRDKRMEFTESFFTCYNFRLLYQSGTQYPILGALRMSYPSPYQIYKRIDVESKKKEEYVLLPHTFQEEPSRSEISDAYYGRPTREDAASEGIWAFLTRIFN